MVYVWNFKTLIRLDMLSCLWVYGCLFWFPPRFWVQHLALARYSALRTDIQELELYWGWWNYDRLYLLIYSEPSDFEYGNKTPQPICSFMTNNRWYKVDDLNITENGAKVRAQIVSNADHWTFLLKSSGCSSPLLQLFKVSKRGKHGGKRRRGRKKKKNLSHANRMFGFLFLLEALRFLRLSAVTSSRVLVNINFCALPGL